MASVQIGAATYEVRLPFHLDVLEAAADAIDRSNQAAEEMVALQLAEARVPLPLLVRALSASVEALHIAIQRDNPDVTLEEIRGLVTLDDVWSVTAALNQALSSSGMTPKGEPKAPAAPTRRRSKTKSGASSATSSSRASAAAIGSA